MTVAFPPPAMTEVERLTAESERIRAEVKALNDRLWPILDRLAELGVEDHDHGEGTYNSPMWSHTHPFDDPDHDHAGSEEETQAQDRIRELID